MYQAAWSLFTNIHETVNMRFVIGVMNARPLNTSGVMFLKTKSLSVFTDNKWAALMGFLKIAIFSLTCHHLLYKQHTIFTLNINDYIKLAEGKNHKQIFQELHVGDDMHKTANNYTEEWQTDDEKTLLTTSVCISFCIQNTL